MLPSWANDTITRVRPAYIDAGHGNKTPDFENSDKQPITGCSVQPAVSSENRDMREAVRVALTVYAPAGSDITAGDFVTWLGTDYRVIAQPSDWRSPTGFLSNMQVDLEVWEG